MNTRTSILKNFFISSFFSLCMVSSAFAQGQASQVIVDVVKDVKSTVAQSASKDSLELDAKLKAVIGKVFDFREMSRRSLAKYWKQATPQQQKDFTSLFSDLLSKNYLKKIRENISESELILKGEQTAGKNKAVVKTDIEVSDGRKAAINYRMRLKKSGWKVYDVIIENIGLVSNYRSEFAGIVQKNGIDGLITKLREKAEKMSS